MITTRVDREGHTVLVVYLNFRLRLTRAPERYRKDARVQSKAGATAEERSVVAYWTEHGTILPLLKPPAPASGDKVEPKTWKDAATRFQAVVCPTKKTSTVRGYNNLLKGPHLRAWEGLTLSAFQSGHVVAEWDAHLCQSGMGESTRRNCHVVLRCVLRCAVAAGWLPSLPPIPKLPRVGRTVVQAVDPRDIDTILYESDEGVRGRWGRSRAAARRGLALMALAGLRGSEVRGLRWSDVDLERGVLTVRTAMWRCGAVVEPPKSGHEREIPINQELRAFLSDSGEGQDLLRLSNSDGHALERRWAVLGLAAGV